MALPRRNSDAPVPVDDVSSPYFLHPSDNPGAILVPQLLVGTNYTTWSRSFTNALLAKNKLVFVDGSITRPDRTDLLFQPWLRCNSMVIAWLRNSVSPQISSSIMFFDDAYAAWSDLKDRFSIGDSARLYQLRQQLMSLTQGNSDVSVYFTNLRIIWDEFRNSQPISWCSCARCTCDSAAKWNKHQEDECTMQFLIGLNSSFSQIRSLPLPSLSKVFSLVIQEERQRHIDGGYSSPSLVQSYGSGSSPIFSEQPTTFANASSPSFGRDKFVCSHCGRQNHSIDRCFYLHGFPPGYARGRGKQSYSGSNSGFQGHNSGSNSGVQGHNSGVQGHKSVNCVEDGFSHTTEPNQIPAPSVDQYQQLINLLHSQLHSPTQPASASASTQPNTSSSASFFWYYLFLFQYKHYF